MPLTHGLNPYSNFPAWKKELKPLRRPALFDKIISGSKDRVADGPERGAYEKIKDGEAGKNGGKK